jgi:hypothetical protein
MMMLYCTGTYRYRYVDSVLPSYVSEGIACLLVVPGMVPSFHPRKNALRSTNMTDVRLLRMSEYLLRTGSWYGVWYLLVDRRKNE